MRMELTLQTSYGFLGFELSIGTPTAKKSDQGFPGLFFRGLQNKGGFHGTCDGNWMGWGSPTRARANLRAPEEENTDRQQARQPKEAEFPHDEPIFRVMLHARRRLFRGKLILGFSPALSSFLMVQRRSVEEDS